MQATLYRYTTGINNKVDAARVAFDQKKGITDLEAGVDILIDKAGGIVSRRDNELMLAGEYLSAYPTGDGISFYAVKNRTVDAALFKVVPAFDSVGDVVSLTEYELRSGLTKGAKTDFCEVDGKVYYMNGYEYGVLDGSKAEPWPVSVWPRETVAPMVHTPAGSHLDMLSSRFLLAIGKELQYTEPGFWGILDNNRNWRLFESRILMIYAVGTGAYVSDEKAVWFLAGRDPNAWIPEKVLNYPAVEFCRVPGLVDPSFFGFETAKPAALFGTVNGPAVGLAEGVAFNLIDKKVNMPSGCSHGSIMVVDETTIIQSGV